jgi:uncharacterized SAM-binding protein YcdF (DUF218 family)
MLGRGLAWAGFSALLAFSLPIVADNLLRTVHSGGPLDLAHARSAEAIVILGGGVRRNAVEYGGDTLGRLTTDRVRYGALVARRTGLPILVTGGAVFVHTPEAVLMKQSLEREFQLTVRWAEAASRNTHENAVNSAEILRSAGIRHVVLVAHSFDIPRATAELTRAGLQVTPAPTHIPRGTFDGVSDLIPNIGALESSYYALYELLANAARAMGL